MNQRNKLSQFSLLFPYRKFPISNHHSTNHHFLIDFRLEILYKSAIIFFCCFFCQFPQNGNSYPHHFCKTRNQRCVKLFIRLIYMILKLTSDPFRYFTRFVHGFCISFKLKKRYRLQSICTVSIQSMYYFVLFLINSSIPFAAAFPAPIARITVAAPVTASPPA